MYTVMNDIGIPGPNRTAMLHALAVVGFIALIVASMWLAVYSTRYVPTVVNRVGAAAVYLGSVFTSSTEPTLSVIPTPIASTTISFGDEGSSNVEWVASEPVPPTAPKKIVPTAGTETTNTYQISGTTTLSVPSGLPDFIVTINAVGYLATTSAESFVASSTVPSGSRPAVRFTIKNIGTNVTGQWRFSASIPTQSSYIYQSQPQQSLASGDRIEYTLGFDQATAGSNKTISITANFDRTVGESNMNNNNASAQLTILGG
ncbi:MAG: hypothetical protein G01um101491_206 [Parcubacteria group bacterium Gr01-1014_91]|nr:MAG: hypothetical protein G01um101491_206 [Parcubacteria group bacterium Gr01-1014_91]